MFVGLEHHQPNLQTKWVGGVERQRNPTIKGKHICWVGKQPTQPTN
jgi:hypothetical protein